MRVPIGSSRGFRAWAFCVALACIIVAGVVQAGDKTALRRGTQAELRSLDPQVVIGNSAGAMMYDLFEGLVTVSADGQLLPGAAESWTVTDGGRTYVFRIREGLRWSDGATLDARDFVYSLQRIVDPKNALRGAGAIFPIRNATAITRGEKPATELGVRAIDPLTLEISLDNPAPFFIDMLASFAACPVPRHAIERYGAQWSMPGNMVTSGAYVLEEWISNTHYKLVKNPWFRDVDNVRIDEVYYYPLLDKETAVQRFRAGELDITLDVPPNRLDWFKKNMPTETKNYPALGVRYLVVNTERPPLDDVRIRRALSISINREVIAEKILRDGSLPVTNIVPAALPEYGPNPAPFAEQPYEQRLAEANRLVAEAGFGAERPLRFTMEILPGEGPRRVAVALQAMWRALGAEVTIVNIGTKGHQKALATGDFGLSWYTYFVPFSDATAFLLLLESDSNRNYSKYHNTEFDAMLTAANDIADPAERIAFLRRAEQLALADFPLIPLFTPMRVYLINQRVHGWINHTEPHLARHLSVVD